MRTEQRIPNPAQVARLHDDLCPWLCSSTLPPCAGQACHFMVTLYLGASPFIIYRSRGSRRPSIAALLCSTSINQSINPQLLLLLLLLLLILRICVLARPIEQSKMASIWKTKVLPGLTKIFDKDGKKAAAVDFLKSFNKEEIGKEIEDKKTELEPKVVEAYQGSPPEVKALFKDKKPVKVTKKNSAAVTKFLDELAKIEFPGAKLVSEAVAKSGTTPLSPAIAFILGKVAPFIPKEEPKAAAADEATPREVPVEEEEEEEEKKKKKEEAEAEAAAAPAASAEPAAAAAEEVVEEKKEAEEKKPAEAAAAAPAAEEEKK